jgi:putative tricarboxylic transport membrane protein
MASSRRRSKAGALRVIGISAPERIAVIDAPTFKEGGVDLVVQNWRMVAAGPGLSAEQVAAITADIEKMAESASWKKTLETKGWINTWLAGDDFKKQLAKEIEATTGILKDIGLVQ